MRWYARIGRRIWLHEVAEYLRGPGQVADGPTLAGFWGLPQDGEEEVMGREPAAIRAA